MKSWALPRKEQISWLAAFLRRDSQVVTDSFLMKAWAMGTIGEEGLEAPEAAPTKHTQNSGNDQDIVLVLDSSDQDDQDDF